MCKIEVRTADGRKVTTPSIVPVVHANLARELGRATVWLKPVKKANKQIDPPKDVVEQICSMTGEWPFSVLRGVIGTPTMRPDGSLLLREGFDEQTSLVLLGAPTLRPIPDRPTRAHAEQALALLDGPLDEVPFAARVDPPLPCRCF